MEFITEILKNAQRPLTAAAIASKMECGRGQAKMVASILDMLAREGNVVKQGKLYFVPENAGIIEGRVASTYSGVDFFVSETFKEDLKIQHSYDWGVMNGDRVLVKRKGTKCEIVKVLERVNRNIVCTVVKENMRLFALPDDKKLHYAFMLPKSEKHKAQAGDKVYAEITSYALNSKEGTCRIIENLGSGSDDETVIKSILRTYGVEEDFPESVLDAAEKVESGIKKSELAGRLDLRKLPVVTIDGDDSKDLDDAVSLEMTERGDFLLGVHIADVSHYVTVDSPLDKEAKKRATSVYVPGSVYPMLPKKLSNGICSLNPDEDRLTLSCFMVISRQGKIGEYSIQPSVIRSKHRLTYNIVTDMIENTHSAARKEYADILGMILLMRELAGILINGAKLRGSIDFDVPEAKITLDENGFPIKIEPCKTGISNRIIEEFMLAANRTVAKHLREKKIPGIFRVHQPPEKKKLDAYRQLLDVLGYSLPEDPEPADFGRILEQAQGKPEETLLKKATLRAMSKAKYKATCDGHFGLAYENYLHFTSPIRRYPDLAVHRALHWSFENNKKQLERFAREAEHTAEICTDREINAAACERDVDDVRKAQYMSRHIGEVHSATVSGVTAYGIYAELENTCEGFIPIGKIDGYFNFDEVRFALVSPQRTITLGDKIEIRTESANIAEGKCEFSLFS